MGLTAIPPFPPSRSGHRTWDMAEINISGTYRSASCYHSGPMKIVSDHHFPGPSEMPVPPSIPERQPVRLRIVPSIVLPAVLLSLMLAGCGDDDTTVISGLPPENVSIACMGKFAEPDCSGVLSKKCPAGCPPIACDAECLARGCESIDLLCPCDGSECFDPNPPPDPEPDPDPLSDP